MREKAYRLPDDGGRDRWPSLWAALRSDPHARDADLLFVLFDERGAGPKGEQLLELRCFAGFDPTTGYFKDRASGKTPWGCGKASDGIHPLLLDLAHTLRWCMTKGSAAPRDWSPKQGLTPGSDCFTALEREERNRLRIAKLKAEDKARHEAEVQEKQALRALEKQQAAQRASA